MTTIPLTAAAGRGTTIKNFDLVDNMIFQTGNYYLYGIIKRNKIRSKML